MNSTILADRLEVWGLDRDFIIFSDGSIGFGFEVVPLDSSCWDADRANALADRTSRFLNGLQVGIDIQFIQEIKSGNEKAIAEYEHLGKDAINPAAKALTNKRIERFRQYDQSGMLPNHALKIFVRRPPESALVDRPKVFSKQKKFQQIAESRLEIEFTKTERLREAISQGLQSLELGARPLSANQIVDLMYWQWNPGRKVERSEYDPENLRSSILFTDAAILPTGFLLSDWHHRVISLKVLPEITYPTLASVMRGLPFDSRLFMSIHVPNQTKELEALQTQRRLAFSMARGKKSGVSDLDSEAKYLDLETLLEQMITQGEKVFHVSVNVLLRSKTIEDLESQVSQTLMTFRELSSAEGMEETLASFDIFSEFAIPNCRAKERFKRIKTSNLCDLLPIYGPWRGFDQPSCLLRTNMGNLFSFDPFSSSLVNANQLISGGSGSGKSFLTNLILLQMLKENPKVFFVDIGGSYAKLCDNLGGQYLPLGVDNGLSINPFDLGPEEVEPSSDKIKFLLGLVELITKEEGKEKLPKFERAEIEDALTQVYKGGVKPKLSSLRDILLDHADPTIKRLGRILTSWCGETPFGRFIDRDTNIELQNPIVAWDLKGVEKFPELQGVCLYLITEFIWRAAQKDRFTKKFLVFDECWQLLKEDAGCSLIESIYRTGRKYQLSAISLSQDITDFANSKIAAAIIPNCSIKWILMQNQSDPKRIKEILSLNDAEVGLIGALSQKKGYYSEAFLIAQKQRISLVIESLPLEYWIATTDPQDLSMIEKFSNENPAFSKINALEKLSQLYPQGIAAYKLQSRSEAS
jgi:conjugal transfer ATP-binding protein TraC